MKPDNVALRLRQQHAMLDMLRRHPHDAERAPSMRISGPQFEYWQHTQLIIDVVTGRSGMFSLDQTR